MIFSDLQFHPRFAPKMQDPNASGIQAKHFFDNGYGISVVRFPGSYGYEEGLYESAVLKGTEENWQICYDTPITSDVIGHQTEEVVEVLLYEIENIYI